METLTELIRLLSDERILRSAPSARSARRCKLCAKPALVFHSPAAEFEYRISGICQDCQDFYFRGVGRSSG